MRRLLQARVDPDDVPTKTTIHGILERHGRVRPRRRSARRFHAGPPDTPLDQPNAMWSADFKGQFRTGNGVYCYPLTVQDGATRFLLGCRGLLAPTTDGSWPVFARLFRRYGLPERIRSDNGAPFAANALGRLSTLSVWWVRLGIRPELIEPDHPEQNGRHERMHKTLKADTARPPEATLMAQQRRFGLVPPPVQHRAAARGPRRCDPGQLLHGLAAALSHRARAGHLSRPLRTAPGQSQRRHSLAESLGECEPPARGTRDRLRRDR